jgi:hypothetical protein
VRLWDTFMLRDGLDMLECRLRELDDSPVYRHFLVESPLTHRGVPKPLHYADNRERFAPWADRIVHVVAALDADAGAWEREHAQRYAIWAALEDAADDDIVILADVDEIPSPQALEAVPAPVLGFRQRLCMYAADWEYPERMLCSVSARLGYVRGKDASAVRDSRERWPEVPGGWHLTWLGGVEKQREKLAATCHEEMTAAEAALIADGHCYNGGIHHSGTLQMIPRDVDETWPRWIWERECPPEWFRPR